MRLSALLRETRPSKRCKSKSASCAPRRRLAEDPRHRDALVGSRLRLLLRRAAQSSLDNPSREAHLACCTMLTSSRRGRPAPHRLGASRLPRTYLRPNLALSCRPRQLPTFCSSRAYEAARWRMLRLRWRLPTWRTPLAAAPPPRPALSKWPRQTSTWRTTATRPPLLSTGRLLSKQAAATATATTVSSVATFGQSCLGCARCRSSWS